jgi:hypothetical protein
MDPGTLVCGWLFDDTSCQEVAIVTIRHVESFDQARCFSSFQRTCIFFQMLMYASDLLLASVRKSSYFPCGEFALSNLSQRAVDAESKS